MGINLGTIPLGSWFSTSAFRNVPGTVQENDRICGFERNSCNLDSSSKMRDSVVFISRESFFVILPSISSETCAIKSSVTPGAAEFCDWLLLGYSFAAYFSPLPSSGKGSTVVKTEIFVVFKTIVEFNENLISKENGFQSMTANWLRQNYSIEIVQSYTIIIILKELSFFLNIFVYTPSQGKNREKYFSHIN